MKFDFNKEFSFHQLLEYIKGKLDGFGKTIKRLDSNNIKSINIKGNIIRINAIRLSFFVALLAIALALFVNIIVIPNTTYSSYSNLEFDTGGQYRQYAFGRDILLLNTSGMKCINNKGSEIWSDKQTLTRPMLSISGNYALLADLDGNKSLNLYNKKGDNIFTYPISGDILSAKINQRQQVVAALSEEGYKGTAVVYNKKGKEIFKWNSGEGYITDVDISNDGKHIAVSQMMSDKETAYSKIHILNISSGQEVGSATCDDSLVAKITFDKNNNIIAVGDNKVYGYTKKCNQRFIIELTGKSPQKFDVENGNNLIFLCKDNRGNSAIEIYSLSGKFLGKYTSNDEIKNICIQKNIIVVATSRNIVSLNHNGKLKKMVEINHDIMSMGVYGNNRNILVLGGNKADIVRIK